MESAASRSAITILTDMLTALLMNSGTISDKIVLFSIGHGLDEMPATQSKNE